MPIGTADIFTADYSSRNGNWDGVSANDSYHTMARVAGGGPQSLDALETTFIAAGVNEIYLGGSEQGSDQATGVARYYRYYEYHNSANDYDTAQGSVVWRHKRLILADGSAGDRVILNTNSEALQPHLEIIFDGSSVGSTGNFTKGAWHAIQMEVIWQTSPTASTLKVWLDNDTYASPDITVSHAITLPTATERGFIGYGRYSNHTLDTGGTYVMRESAFRVATTFDSNWYGWMQNGDGAGSTVVMFI